MPMLARDETLGLAARPPRTRSGQSLFSSTANPKTADIDRRQATPLTSKLRTDQDRTEQWISDVTETAETCGLQVSECTSMVQLHELFPVSISR